MSPKLNKSITETIGTDGKNCGGQNHSSRTYIFHFHENIYNNWISIFFYDYNQNCSPEDGVGNSTGEIS